MVFERLPYSAILPQADSEHFGKWFQDSCHCECKNSTTLVSGFRMYGGFRNPATSKGNFFSTTVNGWNTLTFVTNSSFLVVTGFLPYTKCTPTTLPLSQRAAFYVRQDSKWLIIWLALRLKVHAQFLCHFTFPFFKFWIIPSPCNSFKYTMVPTGNGTTLLWNS